MSADPVPVTPALLRDWALPAESGSKRDRGSVLVIGGGPASPGAVMLAGLAALRVGAGVLSLAIASSRVAAVAAAVPEASVTGLDLLDDRAPGQTVPPDIAAGMEVVVAGPGLDDPHDAADVLQAVVASDCERLVLDAFVLGVLPSAPARDRIAGRAVLTPNSTEAAFLLERESTGDDPDEEAAAVAERYGAVVSLGGAVAAPDGRRWSVPVGHAGLGTSGSGDVLAGCIGGLLARGADPAQAACWGTYLHAASGDRLAARLGRLGFLARELVDELPLTLTQTEV